MAEITISTGRPRFAAIIRTRQPYVLFELRTNGEYVVRLRYLSLNVGTNAAGDTEVRSFGNKSEIPVLSEEYDLLLLYCAGKIIAGELAPILDKDGNLRYPGMAAAYQYYSAEYENQLVKDLEQARRRFTTRRPVGFHFSHAEFARRYH